MLVLKTCPSTWHIACISTGASTRYDSGVHDADAGVPCEDNGIDVCIFRAVAAVVGRYGSGSEGAKGYVRVDEVLIAFRKTRLSDKRRAPLEKGT